MFNNVFQVVLVFILFFKFSSCQRKIVNGHRVFDDKGFVVYLVKSKQSKSPYSGWLCGGVIVSPTFILTAASCLMDVSHVYVIAGYRKYVKSEHIEQNSCTSRMKKRIVSYCMVYGFEEKIYYDDWWNWMDITLARVDTPYDFYDNRYISYCNYLPKTILLNYETEFQHAGRDVVAFGWGSSKYYRPVGDTKDYNEEFLRYASSVIMDRSECRKVYNKRPKQHFNRHTYETWICTHDREGRLDDNGILVRSEHLQNATARKTGLSKVKSLFNESSDNSTARRHGACQNDHGGPLVTWIGGKLYVIGVATAFMVDKKMQCRGPYVYTSVACHNKFIYDILSKESGNQTGCNVPDVAERNIKWN